MKLQFYYIKDKDGKTYLAFRRVGNYDPPIKNTVSDEWKSPKGTGYQWVCTDTTYPYVHIDAVFNIIKEKLSEIPEPSWDDEFPILVTLDFQSVSISYSYIENENCSNK